MHTTPKLRFLSVFALLFVLSHLGAQVKYPVTAGGFRVKPSIYLDDYVSPGTMNMSAAFVLNDYHETAGREVFLRFGIESTALKIQMRSGYLPSETFTLMPGEVITMYDYDFFPWFNIDVWALQGISRKDIENGVRLPDGFYEFTVEVCDARSGQAISNKALFSARIEQYSPPIIIYPNPKPLKESELLIRPETQNIFFQWQMNSPEINMANTEYEIELYEIPASEKNPKASVENHTARQIFRSDPVTTLSYNFTTGDALLELGKRYAFRVIAIDIMGRDMFRNHGISETAYFYYGYPEGGTVPLLAPENNAAFTYRDARSLQWGAADNLLDNQPVRYHLRAVQVPDDSDAETAIRTASPWVDYGTNEAVTTSGNSLSLENYSLGNSSSFAWQVKAWTGAQEIAESPVYRFGGPPVIPSFLAGNHEVIVSKTYNTDISNLSGEGEVRINSERKMHRVVFRDVEIQNINGMLLLTKGEIINKLEDFENIEINADYSENGSATFLPDSFRLDTKGLYLKGVMEWNYPFAVDSEEKPVVRTQPHWYNFNNYKITGTGNLDSRSDFELLDPYSFRMKMHETSEMRVYDNSYIFSLNGFVETPEVVKGSKEDRYQLHFKDLRQLYYNTISDYSYSNYLHLIPQYTELYLLPHTWTLDLSETESAGKKSGQPDWKGVYFDDFEVQYTTNVDGFRQIYMSGTVSTRRETDSDEETLCLIDPKGLQMTYNTGFAVTDTAFFNTFPSALSRLEIEIQNSRVKSGQLQGGIYIPVISAGKVFSWTVPVTKIGFQTGYLDEDLTDYPFIFNENGGEQVLYITIRRAVFEERKRLNMDIDISWPHIGVEFKGLQYFRAWGDYNIGFVEPNGTIALTEQKQGIVNGFEINVETIGGGKQANLYSLGVSSTIVLGEDIAGPDGPSVSNFFSVTENPLLSGTWSVSGAKLENQLLEQSGESGITGSDLGIAPESSSASELAAYYEQVDQYFDAVNNIYSELDSIAVQNEELLVNEPVQDMYSVEWYIEPDENTTIAIDIPEVNNLDQLISLLDILVIFLNESQKETYVQLKETAYMLREQTEEFETVYRRITGLKDYAISAVYGQYAKIKYAAVNPIREQSDKIKEKIISGIDLGVDGAIKLTAVLVDESLKPVEQLCLNAANQCPEGMNAPELVKKAIDATRNRVNSAIETAVKESVDNNVIYQVVYLCDTILIGTIEEVLDIAVKSQMDKLFAGEISEISLTASLGDMESLLNSRWEDIQVMFSGDNLVNTLANTGKDIIRGLDWEAIGSGIVEEMLGSSFNAFVDNKAQEAYNSLVDAAGGEETVAGQILAQLPLNFDNLADNLRNGRLDQIIVFQSIAIKVESKVADFTGYANFEKDNPEWGDVWTAELTAKIKIKPQFTVNARYINGSKSEESSSYKYWFLDIGVKGLNVPVGTTGLSLDGASGRVYHHLSRANPESPYRPDKTNKFGAGLTAYFFDTSGQGTMILFDCGLEVAFFDNGFDMSLEGNIFVGNQIENGEAKKSVVEGLGYLYFSSREDAFVGKFKASVDVAGIICAGGEMGMEFRPGYWEVYLGKRETPIYVSLLCAKNPQFYGWFHINKQFIDLGLAVDIDLNIKGPKLSIGVASIRPWAKFGFEFGASTKVYIKPIRVAEASVWLDLYVGVGFDWSLLFTSGSLTLAGVNLGGKVLFISEPGPEPPKETSLSGKLYGKVTVIGLSFGFNLEMHKDFT